MLVSPGTKTEALNYAILTLRAYFGLGGWPKNLPKSPILLESRGAFVTLTKKGQLRGCIGQIETDLPLYRLIPDLTIAAATKDYRFQPVTREELPEIEIEISLLTKPEKIKDWRKIVLGNHGVIVERDGKRGVFLPQVAREKKFTLESFLKMLCSQKAGLPVEAYKDPKTNLYVFEVEIIK